MNSIFQIEKSQGEIYRLRAKLESTQTENENLQDELEKMQQALNRSYADRDKIVTDLDKLREEMERSQVKREDTACTNLDRDRFTTPLPFAIKSCSLSSIS